MKQYQHPIGGLQAWIYCGKYLWIQNSFLSFTSQLFYLLHPTCAPHWDSFPESQMLSPPAQLSWEPAYKVTLDRVSKPIGARGISPHHLFAPIDPLDQHFGFQLCRSLYSRLPWIQATRKMELVVWSRGFQVTVLVFFMVRQLVQSFKAHCKHRNIGARFYVSWILSTVYLKKRITQFKFKVLFMKKKIRKRNQTWKLLGCEMGNKKPTYFYTFTENVARSFTHPVNQYHGFFRCTSNLLINRLKLDGIHHC